MQCVTCASRRQNRSHAMHAVVTPGAVWMSRRCLICLIQLDHALLRPIGVSIGHVDTPRCSWECAGIKTNSQYRSGGLPDRPGVPTVERPSRHISIGIDSYAREDRSGSAVKRSSYIYRTTRPAFLYIFPRGRPPGASPTYKLSRNDAVAIGRPR